MSSTRAPQVLVIGFGAVGSIYALALTKAGAEVTALCRSNYDQVKENGIDIFSAKFGKYPGWKPHQVIKSPEQAREHYFDYVICTFKCVPDLEPTSEVIQPYLRNPADFPNDSVPEAGLPCIVLMQNGIGNEQEPYDVLVREQGLAGSVISAVSWVTSNLLDGGKRVEHGSLERLSLGVFPSPLLDASSLTAGVTADRTPDGTKPQARLDALVKLLQDGGATPEVSGDVQPQRWKKLLWNASWGALSTVSRQPVAQLCTEASLHYTVSCVRRLMLEVLYVGRACGFDEDVFPAASVDEALQVTLDMRDVPQSAQASASLKQSGNDAVSGQRSKEKPASATSARHSMSPDFKPSLLLDLENGRPMELLPIIGNVIELARMHRMETPRLDLIMAALRPAQVQAIEAARRKWGGSAKPVKGPAVEGTPVSTE
ncbi:unnamed protein product [Tilletia controversa]|uniref:2-dehydropantoate 2-reductase n=3 Tax=Tilletia TaxID=13289 RepID=A0A8X7MNI2_9BASI|nr:hypothetical protein CF336_g5915 [Tilletia laevis]KAE8191614.1 hypothetical protein CF328_g5626 [Tilletia controversa]KAE8256606.1 hypothetical protein A4X03_0g5238 [Tilletia caries]KAE8194667.1 hypothetical protein CF335_g5287 [Tilletia laevis]KAE8243119.1 hypothetical protein A4X06_0g6536 [Tilletia controversa]